MFKQSLKLIINSIFFLSIVLLIFKFIQIRIEEYQIYKKYNGMHGIIIDAYPSIGKYGSGPCMITVKLDDNTIGLINGGYTSWKIGDSFINEINYNHIFGIYGFVYSLPNLNIWIEIIIPCITIILLLIIIYYISSSIYKLYKVG